MLELNQKTCFFKKSVIRKMSLCLSLPLANREVSRHFQTLRINSCCLKASSLTCFSLVCAFMRKAPRIQLAGWEKRQGQTSGCSQSMAGPACCSDSQAEANLPTASASTRAVSMPLAASRHCQALETSKANTQNQVSAHQSTATTLEIPDVVTPAIGVLWKRELALPGWQWVCLPIIQPVLSEWSVKLKALTGLIHTNVPNTTAWQQLSLRIEACKEKTVWRCPWPPHDTALNHNSTHG